MIFTCNMEPFPSEVVVAIDVTSDQLVRWMRRHQKMISDDEKKIHFDTIEAGRTLLATNGDVLLWIPKLNDGKTLRIDLLAHEIFHAVHLALEHYKFKLNDDTDELFAYSIQNLMYMILKKLGRMGT